MKTLTLSTIAIIISLANILAQTLPRVDYIEEPGLSIHQTIKKLKPLAMPYDYLSEDDIAKSINGKIWVLDSSYHYLGNGNYWDYDYRYLIVKRDNKGRLRERLYQKYKDDKWINESKYFIKINDETGEKEEILLVWDSKNAKWGDTIYYQKMLNDLKLVSFQLKYSKSDSTYHGTKDIWKYDENGKLEYTLFQVWSPDEKIWVNKYKIIEEKINDYENLIIHYTWDKSNNIWFRYSEDYEKTDERGNFIYGLYKEWNDSLQEIVNNQQLIVDYNKDNKKTLFEIQVWDIESGKWINDNKYTVSYSDIGLNLGYSTFRGEKGKSYWIKEFKRINSYNPDSTLKSEVYQIGFRSDTLWHNIDRNIYEYKKDTLDKIRQRWINNDWVNFSLEQSVYNNIGYLKYKIDYNWDNEDSKWVQLRAKWNSYDSNGNLIKEIDKTWFEGDWQNDNKTLYEYNSNNKRIKETEYGWDYINKKWNKYYLELWEFDDNDNMTLNAVKQGDDTGDYWVNLFKYTYFYSQFETTKLHEIENTISVFPNPAKDFLLMDLERPMGMKNIKIYASNGIKVLDKTIYKNKIDISSLKKGMYFLEISLDNKLYKSKFVKFK